MNKSAKLGAAVGVVLLGMAVLAFLLLGDDPGTPSRMPTPFGDVSTASPRPTGTRSSTARSPSATAQPAPNETSVVAPTQPAPTTDPDAAPVQLVVRGRVVEQGGAPITGAQVVLWAAAPRETGVQDNSGDGGVVRRASLYALRAVGQVPFDLARAQSGVGGTFAIGPLAIRPTPGARLNLSAEVTNREGETRIATTTVVLPAVIPSGGVDAGDVVLTKLPALRFLVRARGAPVEKARIAVYTEVTPPGWTAAYPKPQATTLRTDVAGKVGHTTTAERVAFSVAADGFATEHGVVKLRPEGVQVSVDLDPEAVVEGVVVDPRDAPVVGAEVEAYEAGGGREAGFQSKSEAFRWIRLSARVTTNDQGRFRIGGLAAKRTYTIYGRPFMRLSQTHAVAEVVPPQRSLRLKLQQGGALKAEAKLPPGAKRPGRISFVLQKQQANGWQDVFLQHVGPDAAPTVTFARVLSSVVRVSVHAPGYAPVVSEPIEVQADQAGPVVVLQLQGRGRTLTGRVLDAASRPLPAALVVWRDYGIVYAVTDGEGRFTLANLPADPLSLTITLQGYAPKAVEVAAGSTTVPSVVLQPAR